MKLGAENRGFFEPVELAQLQRILEEICAQRGVARQSEQGETVATALINHYQRGLRGEELFHAAALAVSNGPGLSHSSAEAGREGGQDGLEHAGELLCGTGAAREGAA